MKYKTAIGEISLEAIEILTFPHGILGFENLTKWAIRESGEPGLSWLLSLEMPEIAFIIWHVREYLENYVVKDFEIAPNHQVYTILTMRQRNKALQVTANLLAPIIIDLEENSGMQHVMNNVEYSARAPLFIREEGAC